MTQINYSRSSKFAQIFSYCFEEILGRKDWDKLIQNSGMNLKLIHENNFPALQKELIKRYGLKTAQGIWQRVGRVAFHQIRRHFNPFVQLTRGENRYQPLSFRLPAGLYALNEFLNENLACQLSVITQEKGWQIDVDHCPECSHDEADQQCCFFLRGLLQEYLLWIDARKEFRVEETQCGGGHCRFIIIVIPTD